MKALVALVAVAAGLSLAAPANAAVGPVRWCGERATTDRVPDRAGGEQVHVAYVVAADGEDRFDALASAIAWDVASIDNWWQSQDPTRAPRFDLFDFPSCESRFGLLDLTFVRLPQPASFYAQQDTFIAVATVMIEAGFAVPWKKYLVYYDGFGNAEEENICGTAGGPYAIVFLRSGCQLSVGGGVTAAVVAAHELVHSLGALPPGAPHPCPGDPGHPCDDDRDIIWPFIVLGALDSTILDSGRDDYYAHGGAWFDLQDSPWLLDPARQALLTATVVGTGRIDNRRLFECTLTCVSEWNAGTEIGLEATPGEGFLFRGWTGPCAGQTEFCEFVLNESATVTAIFRRVVRVTLAIRGRGTISGPGTRCSRSCAATVGELDVVTLRATAARGWRFSRWRGSCRGTRPRCTVRAGGATRVEAVFVRR